MLRDIDNFYLQKEEPTKGCLEFLRKHILAFDENITEAWKYSMPFFCYKGKMFCYLWTHKKTHLPYLGIVEGKRIEHSELVIENRSRMKIMMFDPSKDLPIETIDLILRQAINLYISGEVKIKN